MKFCPECGTQIARENSKFCDNCGAPLQYGVAPGPEALPLREAHEEKSPYLASLCSSFIPGLGQVYNGMTARGVVFFTATLIGFVLLVIPGLFFGFLLGAVIGPIILVSQRKDRKTPIPFGPFLAAGAVLALFAGRALIDWYLGLL